MTSAPPFGRGTRRSSPSSGTRAPLPRSGTRSPCRSEGRRQPGDDRREHGSGHSSRALVENALHARPPQPGHGRRRHRLLGGQGPLQLLAAAGGDQGSGHRRLPGHGTGPGVDAAAAHPEPSLLPVRPFVRERRGGCDPGRSLRREDPLQHRDRQHARGDPACTGASWGPWKRSRTPASTPASTSAPPATTDRPSDATWPATCWTTPFDGPTAIGEKAIRRRGRDPPPTAVPDPAAKPAYPLQHAWRVTCPCGGGGQGREPPK